MKAIGGVFIIIVATVAGSLTIGKHWYGRPTHMVSVTILSASASPHARQQAQQLITHHQAVSVYPKQACALLQASMPAAKKITMYRHSDGYKVVVTQQKPVSLINQTHVLTADGCCIDKQQFTQPVVEQLFAYQVVDQTQVQDKKNAQEQVRFARTFDTDMLKQYTVSWIDWSRIELIDKQDSQIRMIMSADMACTPETVKAYEHVKKDIKALPASKKGRVWQVDMRFKNQILVC